MSSTNRNTGSEAEVDRSKSCALGRAIDSAQNRVRKRPRDCAAIKMNKILIPGSWAAPRRRSQSNASVVEIHSMPSISLLLLTCSSSRRARRPSPTLSKTFTAAGHLACRLCTIENPRSWAAMASLECFFCRLANRFRRLSAGRVEGPGTGPKTNRSVPLG